jgi:hypothetical protein
VWAAGAVAVTERPSDRALQDDVIRALADAPYRSSPAWRERGLADPDRMERYARFLARHFYYERIVHFFKYSRALARVTARWPEAVLRHAAFEALLPSAILGSRDTARSVARLVVEYVAAPDARIPYLTDLLRYEEAMLTVEAGPRIWRDGEPRDGGASSGAPETVAGTVVLTLAYDLPVVLPQLLRPWTAVPEAPMRPTKLLVARSPHGRVAVARTDDVVAAVLDLADGKRSLADLARGAGIEMARLATTLDGLVELGAVGFATGS